MAAQREKPPCLIVCSSHSRGVSAQSFIHAFTLTSSTFNVFIATPEGRPMDFVDVDETNRQWVSDFTSKQVSMPQRLENMDGSKFIALLIPSCPGAPFDLANNHYLSTILENFTRERKPICVVGFGVTGLFSTAPDRQSNQTNQEWGFRSYTLTAPSTLELARRDDFPTLPFVPADFIRKHGATYSSSCKVDSNHVVIDNHIVSGQNAQSTLTAVQNLILLSNARLSRQR